MNPLKLIILVAMAVAALSSTAEPQAPASRPCWMRWIEPMSSAVATPKNRSMGVGATTRRRGTTGAADPITAEVTVLGVMTRGMGVTIDTLVAGAGSASTRPDVWRRSTTRWAFAARTSTTDCGR